MARINENITFLEAAAEIEQLNYKVHDISTKLFLTEQSHEHLFQQLHIKEDQLQKLMNEVALGRDHVKIIEQESRLKDVSEKQRLEDQIHHQSIEIEALLRQLQLAREQHQQEKNFAQHYVEELIAKLCDKDKTICQLQTSIELYRRLENEFVERTAKFQEKKEQLQRDLSSVKADCRATFEALNRHHKEDQAIAIGQQFERSSRKYEQLRAKMKVLWKALKQEEALHGVTKSQLIALKIDHYRLRQELETTRNQLSEEHELRSRTHHMQTLAYPK